MAAGTKEGQSLIRGGSPTVYVTDLNRAVSFYTQILGLKLLYRGGDHFAMVDAGGFQIGLHPAGPHSPSPGTSGSIQVGFGVGRPIDEVVGELQRRGVGFRGPVLDDGPVKLAYFADPDGNDLYLCESPGS